MWMALLEQVFPELITYNIELLECLFSEDVEYEEMRKKVKPEIQASVKRPGRHLFPIHCPQAAEHPDGHWTLLSLEKRDVEAPLQVRYFETLNEANEVCVRRAHQLLRIIGEHAEVERTNAFRQSADDCGWWVLHYAEVEARLHHDEGLGACLSIGHAMRKPQLRHWLKRATE